MKLCIITGGNIESSFVRDRLAEEHPDCILAADHGLVFCRREQIVPDYIVGDFDSTDPEIVRYYREDGSIPIDTYQPEKDFTDTDIAIQKAIALGADEVILFGATGSRLDHTLSNIWNLSAFCREGIKACIEDPHNRITMLPGREYSEKFIII